MYGIVAELNSSKDFVTTICHIYGIRPAPVHSVSLPGEVSEIAYN